MSDQRNTSGRVESKDASVLMSGHNWGQSANDSHDQRKRKTQPQASVESRQAYVTAARVASIQERLNERQWRVLRDVGRLGVSTGRQLERLHYEPTESSRRLARAELKTLVELQVLQRLTRRIGGVRSGSNGFVYAMGIAGQWLLHPDRTRYRPPWTPRPSYLRHALTVSDLYVRLREIESSTDLHLLTFDAEPRCWRSFVGPGGAPVTLKPDAYIELLDGAFEDRYFVEVDLASEAGPRILLKAKTYVRYWQSGREQEESQVFPKVFWVTTTEQRRGFLTQVLSRFTPEHWQLFAVTTTDELEQALSFGTSVPTKQTTNKNTKEVNR